MKILDEIFNNYRSDKGSMFGAKHNYSSFYETLFFHIRNDKFNLLEIGIQEGYSIKSWLDYFSKAKIFAVDRDIHLNHKTILQNDRVKFYYGEAESINFDSSVKFKVIIDDADHGLDTQQTLLRKYFPKLKKNGFYIIEDLFVGKLPWGANASIKKNFGLLYYLGEYQSPNEGFFPKFIQDIAFLNRLNLCHDILEILKSNNHFITVSSISKNGGLHLSLIIFKL